LALILGFTCANGIDKEGCWGDTSRAVGEIAMLISARAKEINREHQVVDNAHEQVQRTVNRTWNTAREYNEQHNLLERTKDTCVFAANATYNFVNNNRLVERTVEGATQATYWTAERILARRDQGRDEISTTL
jgi:YD repeat-containing protein